MFIRMEEKRNESKNIIVTMIVAMAMFGMTVMTAFADSYTNVHISLGEYQFWTYGRPVTRSGKNNYISVSLESVYPLSGTDTFKRIQVCVAKDPMGGLIMEKDYETLTEGAGYKDIEIKNGYLDLETVYLQFRGNTEKAAEAVVSYKGN